MKYITYQKQNIMKNQVIEIKEEIRVFEDAINELDADINSLKIEVLEKLEIDSFLGASYRLDKINSLVTKRTKLHLECSKLYDKLSEARKQS